MSGMESKISTNTCAPKTGILKSSNSLKWRGKAENVHIFPDKNNKKREDGKQLQTTESRMCKRDQYDADHTYL